MKTIEFRRNAYYSRNHFYVSNTDGDDSGVYVPLADYERLRRALEEIKADVGAVSTRLTLVGGTDKLVRILENCFEKARKALEGSDGTRIGMGVPK